MGNTKSTKQDESSRVLLDLHNMVAVVTGGGDGIGRGCALILAYQGCAVVVSDINKEKAQAVVDEIN